MPSAIRQPTQSPAVSDDSASHQSHAAVVNRLKRADGHLQKIVAMIEDGRNCTDVAQQMHAVIRALESAKTVFIHDHVNHCLEEVVGPVDRAQRDTIAQFKEITKYL